MIRLAGNVAELAFNYGELTSLEAPAEVSGAWTSGLASLKVSLDSITTVVSNYVSGAASLGDVQAAVDVMRGDLNNLSAVISQVG